MCIGVSTPLWNHLLFLAKPAPFKLANCPSPPFSSSVPSYILKVTKFLGKISEFEFLVITKKNIFAYKLFLSSNISDFNLLCDSCTPPPSPPPKKVTPLFPSNPPVKVEVLSSSPFLKFGWRLNPTSPPTPTAGRGGGGAHYVTLTETDKLRIES